jgi:acyl carrier protein
LDTRQAVREHIGHLLQGKGDTGAFQDDESLVVAGRLASIDFMHVVLFLEDRFRVDFSQGFDRNELDTVNNIVALIVATQG